jgi:hypothetical protein
MPKRAAPKWIKINLDDIPATKTSVQFGKSSTNTFTTTNSLRYNEENAKGAKEKMNKDFIHDIKSNHFDYGDTRP